MARKIISKGAGNSSHSKRQPNVKGGPTIGSVGEASHSNNMSTSCRHSYHHGDSSDIHRRPFRSENNLFSGNTSLHPLGEPNMNSNPNCHNQIVNAQNGFIPISKPNNGQENKLAYEDDSSQIQKCEGGSAVTMFKTKVLYHSRSDFRPIGLTEDPTNLTESREKEANV